MYMSKSLLDLRKKWFGYQDQNADVMFTILG